ncbi:Formamidopyrimidine-DNA glycosylase [compost metagenome]
MPELPEVETTARELAPGAVGRRIVAVERLDHPPMVEAPDLAGFEAGLVGRRIEAVSRRAKWILVHLEGGGTLAVHLRMTGVLRVTGPDEEPDRHTHLVLALDDGHRISFRDTRKFGRVRLLDSEGLAALDAAHGPEPLDDAFTSSRLAEALHGRKTRLKPLLLDQAIIAGIGNIYADEALFEAGLHPLRAADSLSAPDIDRLHAAIRGVLSGGVERKARYWEGAVRAHEDFDAFAVYDRAGEPCRRCGTPIARMLVAQRGTHYCPTCQPG